MTITAPGQIDGRRCELLRSLPGVEGAGAIRKSPTPAILTALPDAPATRYEITPAFSTVVMAGRSRDEGVLISNEIASAVHLSTDDDLLVDKTSARVQGVYDYPADGRRPGLGWAVLVATTTESSFDECWVRQWPQDPALRTQLMQVITPSTASGAEQPVVAPLNETLGVRFTGTQRYHDRILQYVPLALFAMSLGLGALSVRMRRLEIASNLHAGARRRDIHTQTVFETLVWSLTAGAAVFAAALAVTASVEGADRIALNLEGARGATAIVVGCVAGASLAVTRIRVKDFFAYFKDRG